MSEPIILLIDDETQVLETSRLALLTHGHREVMTCSDSRQALALFKKHTIKVVVMDIMMPFMSGKELLPIFKQEKPEVPIIMMTALGDVQNVVDCMNQGAFDYLDKPVENFRLVTSIQRGMDFYEMNKENATLKNHLLGGELRNPEAFSEILTQSEGMKHIFGYIESIAETSRAVLITGETGTGKELVAKSVHTLSKRKGLYVAVNVAGLDDTLFSDALFGHRKGAFTGADSNREGLLEQAQGGTIFLDEIGDLSMASQVKLLRLLQEREYYPLGSDIKKRTDARFVVATSCDIRQMIRDGSFRKDLYYRLQAHQIHLPPLRERKEDLPLLIEAFVALASKDLGKEKPPVSRVLEKQLREYAFPGNIRELESMIFNAVSQYRGTGPLPWNSFQRDIALSSGEDWPKEEFDDDDDTVILPFKAGALPTVDECVDYLIKTALEKHGGNQSAAARALGITRQGMLARLKRRKIT